MFEGLVIQIVLNESSVKKKLNNIQYTQRDAYKDEKLTYVYIDICLFFFQLTDNIC